MGGGGAGRGNGEHALWRACGLETVSLDDSERVFTHVVGASSFSSVPTIVSQWKTTAAHVTVATRVNQIRNYQQ
jgi:hypothetical protein